MKSHLMEVRVILPTLKTLCCVLLVLCGDIPGDSRYSAFLLLSAFEDDLHPVSFSLLCHNYFRLNKVDISFLLCIPEGLLETVLLDVPDALAGNLKCHEPLF